MLLCDDNVINQKVAVRLLQQMGYRADLAANGLEALAALDRQPYDLIFMDVMMPEMGGFEATRLIRERQRQQTQVSPITSHRIVIVAMTASAMQGDREKCLGCGHGRLRGQARAPGGSACDRGTVGWSGRPDSAGDEHSDRLPGSGGGSFAWPGRFGGGARGKLRWTCHGCSTSPMETRRTCASW